VQSSILLETEPRYSELDYCWQQPRAYTYHNSKETGCGRPSGNEVTERAIGVYMGRNDLKLVGLRMHDSKASYVVTVCSARWGVGKDHPPTLNLNTLNLRRRWG
jgi:hypothetical protein